jgi:beta-glucanase (GH16 family)
VWSDEFDGPADQAPDPTSWELQRGGNGWGNSELQTYTDDAENASLDGAGHLAIVARRGSHTGEDGITRAFTAARRQTLDRISFLYGRVEARVRVPAGSGLRPAFWAGGADFRDSGWPASGEIDVMEIDGHDPRAVAATIHGPRVDDTPYKLQEQQRSDDSLAAEFHTYGLVWQPGRIEFTLDGVTYATMSRAELDEGQRWVFDKPFALVLNLAVGGGGVDPPSTSTQFPATMLVDWVRVYQA